MKIARIRSWTVELPIESLAGVGVEAVPSRPFVVLQITTDDGIEGIGLTTFGGALTRALGRAIEDLATLLVGADPLLIEANRARLFAAAGAAGPEGLFTLALATIDMALWDIKGKAFGLPLWRLLGGGREKVATYASGAINRGLSDAEAIRAAQRLIEAGFHDVKMQLALPGRSSALRELERARLIREVVGPERRLTADINLRWRVDEAVAIGSELETVRLGWLEDVTDAQDFPGLARIATALNTPLCGGEKLWGVPAFRQLIASGSTDIVMIDLFRVGGITPWLKIAALAEAFNLPVVSHLLPEVQVHLVGAVPNGLTVEYIPWSFGLFEAVPTPVEGFLTMPTEPGLGLRLNRRMLPQ